ncbi:hypothetical protein IC762_30445 [Bradyrhizobium genosp. L]|uniref:hypothetical protein n=1 Tax=Bradyrhizobium genosp. L TaxID=83637 RepID=UPI0018A2603C|nr:hypothetical protein [Bradyrhizobium genosp. L]QPF83932.1 hypothetical protein IC762_30445 [Bradyrhizobium genosp. L]
MLAPSNPRALQVPARHLRRGDVTGSGETVLSVSIGARTPRGKVEVALQKGDRKRSAHWNASTMIGVRRDMPATPIPAPAEIPLSDRLSTFKELATFDAAAAWDKLAPVQQREIGTLALRFGTVGQCGGFFHETLDGVRKGFETGHWSPEAQATAIWPSLHIQLVESAAQTAFQALCDHFDPLWPQLFGWLRESTTQR